MTTKRILVTGGSGMVGKFLKEIMPGANYLSSKDCDLTNQQQVQTLFNFSKPDVIIHLAAKVGGIVDNMEHPAEYFYKNIMMNTLLLEEAKKHGVSQFMSILSTCVYPDVMDKYPMVEEDLHSGPPTVTNFSYGYAKRCAAVQTDAYNKEYGLNYSYLIPCNLYGEHDKFDNNSSHFVSALIKKIHEAKIKKADHITLFGSGKPLRQFMYAKDLAKIIKYCIDNNISENLNVATNENLTIKQMAEIALKACDAEHLKIEFDSTKPDGQFRKDVSIEKLKSIIPSFEPISLKNGIKQTYKKLLKSGKLDV